MPQFEISIIDFSEELSRISRPEIRKRLTNLFIDEVAGSGKKDLASKYVYIVEDFNEKKVILKRPARLNHGYDFEVHVLGEAFFSSNSRQTTRPSHRNIIEDLNAKKNANITQYNILFAAIEELYNCNEPTIQVCNLNFNVGYNTEIIFKVIKWLFIEQDITYWNYSGREMLWNEIPRP